MTDCFSAQIPTFAACALDGTRLAPASTASGTSSSLTIRMGFSGVSGGHSGVEGAKDGTVGLAVTLDARLVGIADPDLEAAGGSGVRRGTRSEEHTSELQSPCN